ncbi:kinase-like domain-containing protein [Crassisporium funariophilum]|nr:kinase-like domain-containing protein [Crassisporium funariophilum]
MSEQSNPLAFKAKSTHDPKMIGLWKVGRTLGKGFSGHVRIARHSKTGQYAAIKIIPKGSFASRVSLNRLADEVEHNLLAVEREIVVMKLIDHPNIMRLYDVWETSTSLYLILEYVQGGELFEFLCSKGRRPVSEVLGYFQQIICAVDYCHRYNIAHRDLKLENILIDQDSNIKIADFGMATWQDNARGKLLRTSCGSPHYAAPEIITGKPYSGAMIDIWSCGIILYALLAAKLPFDDDDCPTLLKKIAVGKYVMPPDIDPQAQHLISRMLTTNDKERITMAEIMRHPFFTSQPMKNPNAIPSDLNFDNIALPIGNLSSIDPDIFANLRTLWHGTPDAEIMESLMSPERNWQKGIYHLLVNYRKKYLAIRQEEEEFIQARIQRKKSKQVQKGLKPSESLFPPRDNLPIPRSAKARDIRTSQSATTLNLRRPHAVEKTSMVSPLSDVSSNTPAANANSHLPLITVPELDDAKIQVFFQQIANHLNVLQTRSPDSNLWSGVSNYGSPLDLLTPELDISSMNLSAVPETPQRLDIFGEGTKNTTRSHASAREQSGTKPLTVRRKGQPIRSTGITHSNNKENMLAFSESVILNRRSPLTEQHAAMQDVLRDGRRQQLIETPNTGRPPKLQKKRLSVGPISPLFSDAGSSFSLPSPSDISPRRTWIDNVFKFKQATYSLHSRHDVHTTRIECRRLLVEMDILVSLEESEKLGILKCRSNDIHDTGNVVVVVKSVKFRVELQWPTPQLCQDGYVVSLLLVQEKGSLEAFKAIYMQLTRDWTLGHIDKGTPSVVSMDPSSTRAVGGRFGSQIL